MSEVRQRLFTGLQPSGELHIGNYFGAIKPFADQYESYDSFLMVADYHALTTVRDPETLRGNITSIVKDYLAAGIDPERVTFFKQSDIQEHTELAWVFECLVTVPFLMQAHAYKDKTARGIEASAGLFNYPMLMAADILLYDADIVPVGQDQRQHVEYAREAANKFNRAYGQTFVSPREHIQHAVSVVPGTDGQKMSKSYKNTIPIFGTRQEIQQAVMSIVTDSAGDRPEHVYAIHKLLKSEAELEPLYAENRGNYKMLKEALVDDLDACISPLRARRAGISDDDVRQVLSDGGSTARTVASQKMEDVRKRIGVTV